MSSLHEEIREWLQELETGAARPEVAVPEIKLCGWDAVWPRQNKYPDERPGMEIADHFRAAVTNRRKGRV